MHVCLCLKLKESRKINCLKLQESRELPVSQWLVLRGGRRWASGFRRNSCQEVYPLTLCNHEDHLTLEQKSKSSLPFSSFCLFFFPSFLPSFLLSFLEPFRTSTPESFPKGNVKVFWALLSDLGKWMWGDRNLNPCIRSLLCSAWKSFEKGKKKNLATPRKKKP